MRLRNVLLVRVADERDLTVVRLLGEQASSPLIFDQQSAKSLAEFHKLMLCCVENVRRAVLVLGGRNFRPQHARLRTGPIYSLTPVRVRLCRSVSFDSRFLHQI